MSRLGVEYLVAWPLLSVILAAAYILLARAVRADDARRRAQARDRYPRSNVRTLPTRADHMQIVHPRQ